MTLLQAMHHAEQMDAARREFEELWRAEITPRLPELGVEPDVRAVMVLRHLTWVVFVKARRVDAAK